MKRDGGEFGDIFSLKKVLFIHYSQTGQLTDIMRSVAAPLEATPEISVAHAQIVPKKPYKFPWGFWHFFNHMPESVYEDAPEVDIVGADLTADYDLIVLGYTVWFLSPSMPTTGFLDSEAAKRLLAGKQVITVIGCRNMWLMAQERIKQRLADMKARLTDNVVLIDSAHSAFTFVSTPIWMVWGHRGPLLNGWIPAAGISKEDIAAASRFGAAIAAQLPNRPANSDKPMLSGLGAVKINDKLIASEAVIKRGFKLWGALARAAGKPSSPLRYPVLALYFTYLFLMVVIAVPILAVVKKLLTPLTSAKIAKQKAYFAAPSGESRALLERNA